MTSVKQKASISCSTPIRSDNIMKLSYLIFLYGILFADRLETKLLPIEPHQHNIHLSQTIADIILKYFVHFSNNVIIYRAAANPTKYMEQSDILTDVLWLIRAKQSVIIETASDTIDFVIEGKGLLNIFFLDTSDSYKLVLEL